MSQNLSVLHLQSDEGFTGGIASYISRLAKSQYAPKNLYVVVGDISPCNTNNCEFYGSSILFEMDKKYNTFNFLSYIFRLKNFVIKNKINVIHAHALRSFLPALIVSKICGARLIYTNHGLRFTQKKSYFLIIIFQFLEYISLIFSDAVVCIRPYDFNLLKKFKFHRKNIFYIPTRLNFPAMSHSPKKIFSFVGIGSLINVKQPKRFIEWIEALLQSGQNVNAIWLGSGELLEDCIELVNSKKLPIKFLGQVNSSDLNFYLDNASILLLSSDYEVLPLSVIEAYSHGVPVIATNFIGVSDIIIDKHTGFIVSSNLTNIDIQNINNLLTDSNLYRELSHYCKYFYRENFMNSDLMSLEYSRLYRA